MRVGEGGHSFAPFCIVCALTPRCRRRPWRQLAAHKANIAFAFALFTIVGALWEDPPQTWMYFCAGPHGIAEHGMAMSPVDLVRNFVHEHFDGEAEQRRVYGQLWMPMERACAAAVGEDVEVSFSGIASRSRQTLQNHLLAFGHAR